jgi:hypothetical protein
MSSEVNGLRSHEEILHAILKHRPEHKSTPEQVAKVKATEIKNLMTSQSGLINKLRSIEIDMRKTQLAAGNIK